MRASTYLIYGFKTLIALVLYCVIVFYGGSCLMAVVYRLTHGPGSVTW